MTNAKTVPELRAVWKYVLECSESIDPKRLNELWDFYCERLGECEAGGAEFQSNEGTESS